MVYETHSLEENHALAEKLVKKLQPLDNTACILGLYGDLGAGKTTFTQALARAFGIKETVTSPTFIIEKIYTLTNQAFQQFIHIDAYRLESGEELVKLNWKELVNNPKNIIFLEWPERVREILPENIFTLSFTFIDETTRKIDVDNKLD